MFNYRNFLVSVLVLSCAVAAAKDRKKGLLPADILQARTVLVVVDPDAGVAIEEPNANRTAQQDVEKALMKWGRFTLAMDGSNADLIITVRKGSEKMVRPTIGGIPTNNRPVIFEPTDSGGRIGGRQGNPGGAGDPSDPSSTSDPHPQAPHPQIEVGQSQDTFVVYRSSKDDPHAAPLDAAPVWRYTARDALQSPGVPAVEAFRKLIDDSVKQLAKP
jgi:hypothetical protein